MGYTIKRILKLETLSTLLFTLIYTRRTVEKALEIGSYIVLIKERLRNAIEEHNYILKSYFLTFL